MPSPVSFSATGFSTLDTSSGIENLPPFVNKPDTARLSAAENCRFTEEGGVRIRNGFQLKLDLSLGVPVDNLETHPMFECLFLKCGTAIYQTLDGVTAYGIGVSRTLTEKDFPFPYRKDIFFTNLTDDGLRVAVSTVASVNVVGNTLDVRAGDGSNLTNAAFYVRGIQITPSGLTNDQFTGCSGLTADIQVGDIVTQASYPPDFPKGTCIAEIDGSLVVGNEDGLRWSEPSNPAQPELAYVFPVTYAKSTPSAVTALLSGNGVTLIGMKKGMLSSTGFDTLTGVLQTTPLSDVHSIPNAKCIAQMGDEFVIATSLGRILPAAKTDAGFRIIENSDKPQTDMDFMVQKFIQQNLDRTTLSENFVHYDSGSREASVCLRLKTGLTNEFVYQRDIRAWSRDTGKNFRCKAIFKGRTYAGDDSNSFLHLDGEGWDDNGILINFRIATGILRASRKGTTCDYLEHTFGGLLSPVGQFYMRVLLDGSVVENKLYKALMEMDDDDDSLTELMLMDVVAGVAIGGGRVGSELIGSGGDAIQAFSFTVPYEFMGEAQKAQIEFQSTDIIEIRFFELAGETEGELLLNRT